MKTARPRGFLSPYKKDQISLKLKSEQKIEVNKEPFVDWLIDVQNFTPRTASDTLSRIRRADRICPLEGAPNDFYYCTLQQTDEYIELSTSVRSQIKRALTLYYIYIVQNGIRA